MRWLKRLTAKTVIVHLADDQSIRGVLWAVYTDCLVLRHAAYLAPSAVQKLDGEVVIPRERVAWMQTVTSHGEDS